jgi:adenylate kinase family enzyme
MKRIAIIGPGGSGKSTLACELGAILGIEVIHLDALFWKPGWVETPKPEWRSIQEDLVRRESWIMDGNYGGTLDIRLAAADTIIFLDFPRLLCLWRVIKRRVQHIGRGRPDMGPDCPERLTWQFLWWIWTYRTRKRPAVLQELAQYADEKRIFVLRGPADARCFLKETANAGTGYDRFHRFLGVHQSTASRKENPSHREFLNASQFQ